jgi:hypothetical protein
LRNATGKSAPHLHHIWGGYWMSVPM